MPGPNDAFNREPAEGGRDVVEKELEKQKAKRSDNDKDTRADRKDGD